ncbi:MAG: RodZ domain-containing protein [Pseudomonadota bacterium]
MNTIRNRHVFQVPLDYDEHANTTARDDSNIISLDNFKERDDKGNNYNIFGDSDDIDDSNNVVHIDTHANTTVQDLPKDTSDDKSADADMSPGARLRQAREQKNLSLQEIAEKLLLDVQVLKKLEANNYDGLPAPIFVRGYIKSYAKVLAIPQESILESFDRMELQEEQVIPVLPLGQEQGQGTDKSENRDDLWFNIGKIVFIVTLIALLGWWYFYHEEPIQLSLDESPVLPTPEEIPEINEEPWTAFQGNSQGIYSGESEETSTQSEPYLPSPMPEPSILVPEPHEPTNITEPEPVIPPAQSLRVHLGKKDVWMRITDSSGNKLFGGTAQAGRTLNLTGKPPFYVRAIREGFKIEYQGEIKDITDYPNQRGETNISVIAPEEQALRVHLKEDVWMRITDNSDNKLFGGTAQAGKTLNLTGKPPFYVQATRHKFDIEYQGETNGIKAYPNKRGETNIFIVGSDE